MPAADSDRRQLAIDKSRGAQRRRRFTRGIARWQQALALDHVRPRRVALLTFTTVEDDPIAAQGRIRAFWRRVNDRWPDQRYLWWPEFQKRGAIHYHAVWLNPPSYTRVNLQQWIKGAWGSGRTRCTFEGRDWFARRGTDYMLAYAKKVGAKAYQQDYEALPSTLRTFGNQRLGYDLLYLDLTRDHDVIAYVPAAVVAHELREEHLVVIGRMVHGGTLGSPSCHAPPVRRPPRGRPPPKRAGSRGAEPVMGKKPLDETRHRRAGNPNHQLADASSQGAP